jgi:hypothetical protein
MHKLYNIKLNEQKLLAGGMGGGGITKSGGSSGTEIWRNGANTNGGASETRTTALCTTKEL